MNKKLRQSIFPALCLAAVSTVNANTYYWDTNGSSPGAGAVTTGSWDGVSANWTTDPTGDSTTSAANIQYYDNVDFVAAPDATTSGTGAYTVYVNGNQSVNSLTFNSVGNATLTAVNTGNGNGQLLIAALNGGINVPQYAFGTTPNGTVTINVQTKLTGSCAFSVGAGDTLTMGANVYTQDSTDALTKTGLGTLVFSGLTTNGGLSAGLNILQGTVDFTNSSANSGASSAYIQVGNTNGTSTVGDAPTFEMGSSSTGVNSNINLNNNATLILTGGTFQDNRPTFTVANGASATIKTLASTDYIQITHSASQNLGGNSASTLTFAGPGIFQFENSMTFAGNYVLTGNLKLNNNGALGTNQITVDAGGFLGGSNGGGETANAIILNGGTLGDYDCAIFGGGSITVSSPSYVDNETGGGANYGVNIQENVTLNSNLSCVSVGTTGQYNTIAITGVISGTGGLIVNLATNSVELGASNSYTGVTLVTAGNLRLNSDGNTGSAGSDYALAGSTLDTSGAGTITWDGGTNYLGGLQGSGNISTETPFVIGGNNHSTTFSGGFNDYYGIVKIGTGTLSFSGNNSNFTGTTTISAGTLEFVNESALYGGASYESHWTPSNLVVSNGATLALGVGGAGQFSASDIEYLLYFGGGGILSNSSSTTGLEAGASIGFDTSGGSFVEGSLVGPITDSNAGSLGLTKLGSNTLTLDQANTYTGTTTVSAGTLIVSGAISGGGAVNVAGGTLGGNGSIAGATTIGSGATLYPGAASGVTSGQTLTLGSTVTFSGTSTFEVNLDNNGHTADMLAITGNLVIGSNDTLTLNLLNSTPTTNIFEIASYTGTLSGTFASVNWDGLTGYRVDYTTDPGEILIDLSPIPEPGTWAELIGGFAILVFVQRARRKSRRSI